MPLFPDISRDDIFRLETARLWLRWLRANDAPTVTTIGRLADVASDAADHGHTPGEAERFILRARATTASGEGLTLGATLKGRTRTLVGIVSAQVSAAGSDIEVGYVIAPTVAGRGYATEAVTTLVAAIFNLTEARNVLAHCRADNAASRRVLAKCGFSAPRTTEEAAAPSHHGGSPSEIHTLSRYAWSARDRATRLPTMAQQTARLTKPDSGEHTQ